MSSLSDVTGLSEFLNRQRIATVALPIDDRGTIHIAALVYWNSEEPIFYFVTDQESMKCHLIKTLQSVRGACIVGTEYGTNYTLQMHGSFEIVDKDTHTKQIDGYYAKRKNHRDDIEDPQNIFLKFTPDWARYTDYASHRSIGFLTFNKP